MPTPIPELVILPAEKADWSHVQAVFGSRGVAAGCHCQRYKLQPRESFASFPAEERTERLRRQIGQGHAGSDGGGILAYLGGEPVGWCDVEPRSEFVSLARSGRVPWADRSEDRTDASVWAVTCFVVRAGFRRRGIGRRLAAAAVAYARDRGARAIEGYPMTTTKAIVEELHVGTERMFLDAGFAEVSRPTPRRAVMRIDF